MKRRVLFAITILASFHEAARADDPLPGTKQLTWKGDLASMMVSGIDRFLDRKWQAAGKAQNDAMKDWPRNWQQHERFVLKRRARLVEILGLTDPRIPFESPSLIGSIKRPAKFASTATYDAYFVRWPAFRGPDQHVVHGEGVLLEPKKPPVAQVVAVPDCEVTPEQLLGFDLRKTGSRFADRLAAAGCRVVIPVLIDRKEQQRGITHREWLHRSAYELGRTMTGYEVQKILAAVDWFAKDSKAPIGVAGFREGGRLAMFAAAVDVRITSVAVSGSFGDQGTLWKQPLDRNVVSLWSEFGDRGLVHLIAPRSIVVETIKFPVTKKAGGNGAPYELVAPDAKHSNELRQALVPFGGLARSMRVNVCNAEREGGAFVFLGPQSLTHFLKGLKIEQKVDAKANPPARPRGLPFPDAKARHERLFNEISRHNQLLLRECHKTRKARFWDKLDTSSIAAYEKSIARFRSEFSGRVIGAFADKLLPPGAKTRKVEENAKWTRYEVVLDVYRDVFAYGLLTIPKGIKPGEKRACVVCQHGLEGRPQHVIGKDKERIYKAFATRLAERGYVTFAPQNPYVFFDRFRVLQRKANPLGKSLFSIIVPQHQQIVDWLGSLPFVKKNRIAFYGLSYGGKTAMRVPALVTGYCLSICSADFNEWVDKNASTTNRRSYVRTREYEIFEWDLGHTYNYAEMAALICPRPFMVERGHFDGVADDWTVAWEYSKVRFLYSAKLKIPERTTIEWFVGPHAINGVGTFAFLDRILRPKPKK